jgi:hypothetical protein
MMRRENGRRLRVCLLIATVAFLALSCSRKGGAERGGTLVSGEISDFESLNPMGTTDAHARDVYNLLRAPTRGIVRVL